jgi:SAM-dependent methyltransferase
MDRAWYPGFQQNWDDRLMRDRVRAAISPDAIVLDLGAGAGIVDEMSVRGLAARVCGVDLDPRVVENPWLDEGRVADAAALPYSDATFDVVFSDNVLEHLEDPETVFREIARVLRPGGVFLFKTPNRWHYVPLIARVTPHAFHEFVNRLRGRVEADTFPTRYRANSAGQLRRLAAQSGLVVERLDRIEGRPEYLRMSALTYIVGAAFERIVNATDVLAGLRVLLIGQLRKPLAR